MSSDGPGDQRRVFDCLTFTGDASTLLDRFAALDDVVDVFVVVESVVPRGPGTARSLLRSSWSRLVPFAEKIRHVVVSEPTSASTDSRTLRNACLRGLADAAPGDLVLLSQATSIPVAEAVVAAKADRVHGVLALATRRQDSEASTARDETEFDSVAVAAVELERRSPAQVVESVQAGYFDRMIWGSAAPCRERTKGSIDSTEPSPSPMIICPYVDPADAERARAAFGLDEPRGANLPFFLWQDTELIGPERAFEHCWSQFPDRDVIIVHPDMRPMPDDVDNSWYRSLCAWADQLPDAGAIGCDLLFSTRTTSGHPAVQCAGGTLREGVISHLGGRDFPYDGRFAAHRLVEWVTFGGVYLRRSALDMAGRFDSEYRWAYVMDVDYSMRMRLRGLNLYQVPVNLIHDENGSTAQFLAKPEYQAAVGANYELFNRKWGDLLRGPARLPAPTHKYRNEFALENVFGHCVELIRRQGLSNGVHVDVGCGFGVVAEPLREDGLTYLGFDSDEAGLIDLRARGFETHQLDLADVVACQRLIATAIADRDLASISMLDCLEHLPNGPQVLAMLRALAVEHCAILIISVPNVSHFDLGAKLLSGRWDYTDTGLLDRTHLIFYTERHLRAVAAAAGWIEIDNLDVVSEHGDQQFPAGMAALDTGTPLGGFLRQHRNTADELGSTYQLVRAFTAGEPRTEPTLVSGRSPALSVALVTEGHGESSGSTPFELTPLELTLRQLVDQFDCDFELLIACYGNDAAQLRAAEQLANGVADQFHRTRLIDCTGLTKPQAWNAAIGEATGGHIVFGEAGDQFGPAWTQAVRGLSAGNAGKVLRFAHGSDASATDLAETNAQFNLADHLLRDASPLPSLAFPRTAFRDLGFRLDERLHDHHGWDLTLRTALACGVVSAPFAAGSEASGHAASHKARPGDAPNDAIPQRASKSSRVEQRMMLDGIDSVIHALPAGTLTQLLELELRACAAERENADLRRSLSWRVTRPLRAVGKARRRK